MKSEMIFRPKYPGKQLSTNNNLLHVMRFLRPIFGGKISQRGGIAVAFEINYQTNTFVAGYSVCSMNDQFDYTKGRELAASRLNNCENIIEGTYHHALPLMTNFFNEAMNARKAGDILVETIFKLSSNVCSKLTTADMYKDNNSYFLFADRDNINKVMTGRSWRISHLRLNDNYGGLTLLYNIEGGIAHYKIAGCSLKDQYNKKTGFAVAQLTRVHNCNVNEELTSYDNIPYILQDICNTPTQIPFYIRAYALIYLENIYDVLTDQIVSADSCELFHRARKLANQINSL
jgi:hypothetical protein